VGFRNDELVPPFLLVSFTCAPSNHTSKHYILNVKLTNIFTGEKYEGSIESHFRRQKKSNADDFQGELPPPRIVLTV
jgi:hypothetical protein